MRPARFTIQLVIRDLMAADFMEDTTNTGLLATSRTLHFAGRDARIHFYDKPA